MSIVPQPSTVGVRRRKRTKNPSNHVQLWAWHTILIWDRLQLPAADDVGRKQFMQADQGQSSSPLASVSTSCSPCHRDEL